MYSYKRKNISQLIKHKETIITFLVMISCLLFSVFFPVKNSAQIITRNIFFMIFVPILYYKIILRKNISEFGLNFNSKKTGIFWGLSMFLASILIFFSLYFYTNFKKDYTVSAYIVNNFWIFLFHELILVNIFVFIQEFFWRGFVLLYFSEKIGIFSIFLQFVFYALFIILTGNSFWQTTPLLVISLFSGIIVYKSRSIFYSWIFALFFLVILDSFIIYRLK